LGPDIQGQPLFFYQSGFNSHPNGQRVMEIDEIRASSKPPGIKVIAYGVDGKLRERVVDRPYSLFDQRRGKTHLMRYIERDKSDGES
jgi:hypothetical protein